ncbi:MAG: hypothetical protein ABFE13_25415 [Phycisphaerales bacterium]
MTNAQAKLLALPLVMIAGALYSVVREEFALFIGGLVFLVSGILFVREWVKSAKHEG